ncbi:hypothetical protein QYE76_028904 [Lolium multiflorum]|uniref:HTH myb-type domain-containing protein n=1 Tax=Lolium multiflorum TaxID=4521 RepID=A0AAD8QN69_LOLMU|nr:hypothetical protein QYE76_028904 [Lolium multiflorum]
MARFDGNNCSNNGTNDNNKHDILVELHSLFPSKTMQQVKDLYVDLVVEMLTVQSEEEYDGAIEEHHIIHSVDGLINENFGIQEDASMKGVDLLFGGQIFDGMRVVEMEEVPAVEKNKVGVLENKMSIHQPMDAPHAIRLFLCGLSAYGRGKWKNISKYFVTTRTPGQISSHAQKYFKKLEGKGLRKQRYSINDVGLDDAHQWKMKNCSSVHRASAFADADYHNPSFGMQTSLNTSFPMGVNSSFESPCSKKESQQMVLSEKQMMVPIAAPREGAEKFFSYQ